MDYQLENVHLFPRAQVKKIADQLEESERSATTENWGLFLARKEAAFRGQQQVHKTPTLATRKTITTGKVLPSRATSVWHSLKAE